MSIFTISDLPLAGLKLVARQQFDDNRGFFSRIFCMDELAQAGWEKPIAQINHTYTARRGMVRGLHYQRPPCEEMKCIICIRGKVWDVALDIRAGSPTFLDWHAEYLSAERHTGILIPEGFAHGFQTLTDDVEMLYCHSAPYSSDAEAGLNAQDPRLAIAWPLTISHMSVKDSNQPMLAESFRDFAP